MEAVKTREYWATFSIYDYQTPLYLQALMLFDKVVIPVPKAPIKGKAGEITAKDLKQLSAEAQYLEDQGVAILVNWDRTEFEAWRESKAGEAIAQLLDKDRQLATRFQVQEAIEKSLLEKGMLKMEQVPLYGGVTAKTPVTVTPVYGNWEEYLSVWKDGADARFVEIVASQLPMPDRDVPLEAILDLRNRESVQHFMSAFRDWQSQVVLTLLNAHGDPKIIKRATEDASATLAHWTEQFRKDVGKITKKKKETGFVSLLAIGAALHGWVGFSFGVLAKLIPEGFKLREMTRPWWTELAAKPWAPAGIVYEVSQL